jgi:hypothetical protein
MVCGAALAAALAAMAVRVALEDSSLTAASRAWYALVRQRRPITVRLRRRKESGMAPRAICLLVSVALLLVAPAAGRAGILWSESFEYDDSPLNHGWVVAAGDGPVPHTTTDVAWDGLRSLRCDGYSDSIGHWFSGDVAATRVTAMFYDDGDWGYHDEAVIWTRWDNDTELMGLGKYMGPGSNYYIMDGTSTRSTPVLTSVGWHLFEWVQNAGNVEYYIDGIYCGTHSGSTLSAVGAGAGEVGMNVDAMRVEVAGWPEGELIAFESDRSGNLDIWTM